MIRPARIPDRGIPYPEAMRHVLLLLSITLLGGCHSVLRTPVPASQPILPEVRSDLPILAADGSRVSWDELLTALDDAEAIILGETHDDAVAHATQHAIVADMLARHEKVAIAMEMFERDEQPHVDDYLDGVTDVDTLVERTNSAGWGGEDGAASVACRGYKDR